MKDLSQALSSLTLSEKQWHHLFEIDELFNSILSFLPLPNILNQSSLVCRSWYHKISRDGIHSLWPYLLDGIWSFISELVGTNQVHDYNKSNECEQDRYHDDPNYFLSVNDIGLREEFKNNLQRQLKMYLSTHTKIRSKRQASLILSNYVFLISRCSLVVDRKSIFTEPHWIRGVTRGNEISVQIPQFLQVDLRNAQKKGVCCDWSEITDSNWFFSMTDIDLKIDSILLTKRKDHCWTIIHSENYQKRKKPSTVTTDLSPVDQRKDWNFLSNSKKRTIDRNVLGEEDGNESGSGNEEEEILTDIWEKIKLKRASKYLISTFEGRFKPLWIQPKFLKQHNNNTNYLEIPQPLEQVPNKNFKVLNNLISRWISELDKYNLLNVEFVLINTMRVLYYVYTGCVESSHTLLVGPSLLIENSLGPVSLKKIRMWKKSNERKNFKNYYMSIFINTKKENLKSLWCLSVCCEPSSSRMDYDEEDTINQEPFHFEFSEYQL